MEAASNIHVSDTFVEHVVDAVTRTRSHPDVELGASPRAGIALIKAARARALIRGRGYVVPDDLYALAPDVMLHRMRLNYEALADGKRGDDVLQEILHDLTRGGPESRGKGLRQESGVKNLRLTRIVQGVQPFELQPPA